MKREILFRGKRIDNGDWVYGDLIHNIDCVKVRERETDINRIAKSYEVIPETVGQFIGLTDKNGKKIFEGDIVFGYARVFKSVVEWNSEQAGWSPFGDERTSFCADESEIIGNKWEE